MIKKKYFLILTAMVCSCVIGFSQQLSPEQLKKGRWLSQEEFDKRTEVGRFFQPTDAPTGPVNPVAEFESMQGVLIAYPFGIPMNLIVEMSQDAMVTTIVASSSQATSVGNQYQSAGANMDNIDFLIEPHDTYWTRDYGPWFIREEDQISIINFTYNRPRPDDNIMPVNVANMLGISYYNMPVIHTGGNYMNDGFNIAAQTELVYEENSISDDQVDQYMLDYMGVTQNYVISDPLGDYIKHIDCWGKFLDVDKVLVAQVPESDPRFDDYEAAANYFATRDCAYGYPFEVIRVYGPGDYPYTPYTNSLILNKKVFLPITGSQWDDEAIATYEAAMPGYEIFPILDGGSVDWINSDALHCRTHEIADIGMLKITHIPAFHHEVEYQASYNIEAKIHPYSNEALYADSLLVYYKINDGEYNSVVMEDMGDEIFSASIQASPGDEVAYYIHAADESGRSENVPYIGAPDPFVFNIMDVAFDYLTLSPDTLFLEEAEDLLITVSNNSESAIDILDIREQLDHNFTWWIEHTIPENLVYPYSLAPGENIEVYLERIITKDIFYDSLLVITADSNYFSIVTGDGSVAVNELAKEENTFQFSPNPITTQGNIQFELSQASAVELSIYNLKGQLIQTIESSRLLSGTHQYVWDGQAADAGIYLIRLQIDQNIYTKKWVKM